MNSITTLNGNFNGHASGTATPTSKLFYPLFPGIVSAFDESPWASGYNTPALGTTVHNVAERTEAAFNV